MIISLVAALGNNRVIGKNNELPWKLPADLRHFRELTRGKTVVMGQKTFESIGKPLPERTNIVLSNEPVFAPAGCLVARSVAEALDLAKDRNEVMVIGGESVYQQFLPLAQRMYLTMIKGDFIGDAFFPEFDGREWEEKERLEHKVDERNPYNYNFVTLERRSTE